MSQLKMSKEQIRQEIVNIALSHVGTLESPPNSNKTMFGEWYGINGVAWCGIFVSYCYNFAGWGIGKIDTDNGFHYVPTMYYRAIQNGWVTNDPKPGDIVIYDFNKDKRFDHTGIFTEWTDRPKNNFHSVEGNTSPNRKGSQSNGGGVFLRERDVIKDGSIFINLIDNQK